MSFVDKQNISIVLCVRLFNSTAIMVGPLPISRSPIITACHPTPSHPHPASNPTALSVLFCYHSQKYSVFSFTPKSNVQSLSFYHLNVVKNLAKLIAERRYIMSASNSSSFLNDELSKRTTIFGLRLWVVLGICVGAAIVIFLFLISLWFTTRKNKKSTLLLSTNKNSTIPNISREIQEIRVDPTKTLETKPKLLPPPPGTHPIPEPDQNEDQRIHIEIGKGHRIAYPDQKAGPGSGSGHGSGETRPDCGPGAAITGPEVSHLGWGHWYTLRELEEATNGFADENVIGEGGYGIVYHGLLEDKTRVAVKNLLNNRYYVLTNFSFITNHIVCACTEFSCSYLLQ